MQCKVYAASDEFGRTFRVVENATAVKCHFKDLKGSMKPSARLVGFQRSHRSLIRIDEETSGDDQGVPTFADVEKCALWLAVAWSCTWGVRLISSRSRSRSGEV